MWYCTSYTFPDFPGWLSPGDASIPDIVTCKRVPFEVAADNGVSIARMFRVIQRIAGDI